MKWPMDERARAALRVVLVFGVQVAAAALAAAGLVTEGCAGEVRALLLGALA